MTLLNCEAVCPALSHILINIYRNNSQLFVDGQCILSKEGTTWGDPLAMAIYAIGTQPLICSLDGIAKQVWYADDSVAGSSLERLKEVVGSAGEDWSTLWILPEWLQDTCANKTSPG